MPIFDFNVSASLIHISDLPVPPDAFAVGDDRTVSQQKNLENFLNSQQISGGFSIRYGQLDVDLGIDTQPPEFGFLNDEGRSFVYVKEISSPNNVKFESQAYFAGFIRKSDGLIYSIALMAAEFHVSLDGSSPLESAQKLIDYVPNCFYLIWHEESREIDFVEPWTFDGESMDTFFEALDSIPTCEKCDFYLEGAPKFCTECGNALRE